MAIDGNSHAQTAAGFARGILMKTQTEEYSVKNAIGDLSLKQTAIYTEIAEQVKRLYGSAHKWQKEALAALSERNYTGTVAGATGSGKTRLACLIILRFLFDIVKTATLPEHGVLVVVPTGYLLGQWYNTLKFLLPNVVMNRIGDGFKEDNPKALITIAVVNSIRGKPLRFNLLVADEYHMYGSEQNLEVLTKGKYDHIIGLTATLERADERHDELMIYAPVVYTYTVDEAVHDKVVNDYVLRNIEVPLSPTEKAVVDSCSAGISEISYFFLRGKQNANPMRIATYFLKHHQHPHTSYAAEYMRLIAQRKKVVYNCRSRVDTAVRLILENPDRHIIVFGEAIDILVKIQTKLDEAGVTSAMYHSGIKSKRDKMRQIDAFNNKETRVLLTAKALDQGYDIQHADMALIVSATSSTTRFIQRIGRVLRKGGNKQSLVIQLYTRTMEMQWMNKRLAGINKETVE
jgi:superfamily II DNA or RNA helicase